jgi:hypothetical protein
LALYISLTARKAFSIFRKKIIEHRVNKKLFLEIKFLLFISLAYASEQMVEISIEITDANENKSKELRYRMAC